MLICRRCFLDLSRGCRERGLDWVRCERLDGECCGCIHAVDAGDLAGSVRECWVRVMELGYPRSLCGEQG